MLSKTIVQPLHQAIVSNRRIERLSHHLSTLLSSNIPLTGLDVGSGSGSLAKRIQDKTPNIAITGVDILVRPQTQIPVIQFNGTTLPFNNKTFDFVLLIDVLHHTDHPQELLQECIRVTKNFILIKDHNCNTWFDRINLSFMDWVGNRSYGVYLPYNYLSSNQWTQLYQDTHLELITQQTQLNLYLYPFTLIFDRQLHFIAKLKPIT